MDFSTDTFLYLALSALFISLITIALLIHDRNKGRNKTGNGTNFELVKLKLQALERFTLYAERSSLKNLVSRTPANGITVVELHA